MAFFDIYLLEALINGILLGGVFALLSLGLNLIFGVIDVVWICYAELIMLGMYGMYFVYSVYHAPFAVAAVTCIAGVAVLGVILHVLVIAPLLGACSASSSRTSACACPCSRRPKGILGTLLDLKRPRAAATLDRSAARSA